MKANRTLKYSWFINPDLQNCWLNSRILFDHWRLNTDTFFSFYFPPSLPCSFLWFLLIAQCPLQGGQIVLTASSSFAWNAEEDTTLQCVCHIATPWRTSEWIQGDCVFDQQRRHHAAFILQCLINYAGDRETHWARRKGKLIIGKRFSHRESHF
jgi:hypothetical protein